MAGAGGAPSLNEETPGIVQPLRTSAGTNPVPGALAPVPQRRASVAFILVTLGLDALGVGIVASIVPGLVEELGSLPLEQAAPRIGALLAAYAAMQFLVSPLLGALSDRFCRRPVILASVTGLGLDYLLLALAPNLWWLFLGRLVAGATTAYIADVTPAEERPRLFGYIGATFGASFVIGPALGGLLGAYGLRLPFIAAGLLALVNVAFGLFALPESLARENRRPMTWARANPFRLLHGIARDRSLYRLAAAWSCSWIGLGAVQSCLVLFTDYRFGWGAQANGLVLAGIGLSQALVEGLLLGAVVGWLGERRTVVLGYVAGAAGFGILAAALAGWTVAPAVALIALGGLAMPSVRAMVSGRGEVETQGEMQGVLSAVEGLTAMVAPLVTSGLFFAFTAGLLPITFPVAAGAAVLACALMRKL